MNLGLILVIVISSIAVACIVIAIVCSLVCEEPDFVIIDDIPYKKEAW